MRKLPEHPESGQASVLLILILSTFLLSALAFSVDLTSAWFHRQSLQTAADAACQAGALDLLAKASGVAAPNASFTTFVAGTPSNCVNLPGSSVCKYAAFNGYSGTGGFNPSTASNSVSWTFPTSVAGATKPAAALAPYPYLSVVVEENVKTWFMALVGKTYQPITAACTCGLAGVLSAAPMVVLDASDSATLEFGGGATIKLVGGAQRSIQINSSSATAVKCDPSGYIDLSQAGPNSTGGDLAIYGGPTANPVCYSGAPGGLALSPGTTGSWKSPTLPVPDPFGGVAAPTIPAVSLTAVNPEIVAYGYDGCTDHGPYGSYFNGSTPHQGCLMYEPGYYPTGIYGSSSDLMIFKPGIYYLNGSFNLGGSNQVRPATPCVPACSPYSTMANRWQQTDGIMFYFASGQLNINGGSGALSSSRVDPIATTMLTCDGSAAPAALSIPSTVNGNVLVAQCAANGTYYDSYNDTTDSRGNFGSRGLLVYQGHANQVTSTTFSGSGQLAFSGTMYYHDSNSGSPSVFYVNGGSGTTSYILGEIIADKINVQGSGTIKMALSNAANIAVLKVATFN